MYLYSAVCFTNRIYHPMVTVMCRCDENFMNHNYSGRLAEERELQPKQLITLYLGEGPGRLVPSGKLVLSGKCLAQALFRIRKASRLVERHAEVVVDD